MTTSLRLHGTGTSITIGSDWYDWLGLITYVEGSDSGLIRRNAPDRDTDVFAKLTLTGNGSFVQGNMDADLTLRLVTTMPLEGTTAYVFTSVHGGHDLRLIGTGGNDMLSVTDKYNPTPWGTESLAVLFGRAGDDVLTATHVNWATNALRVEFHGGTGNDTLTGSDGNDKLFGGAGSDYIEDEAGDDLIAGGAGADFISAGSGADTFRFNAMADFGDVISGFEAGIDHIEIARSALRGAGTEVAFSMHLPQGNGAQFVFDGINLWYDRDGEGRRAPVAVLTLTDGAPLSASDILLI